MDFAVSSGGISESTKDEFVSNRVKLTNPAAFGRNHEESPRILNNSEEFSAVSEIIMKTPQRVAVDY